LASDSDEVVESAAKTLEKMGYGNIPKSVEGRRTGVVLRQLMEKPNGEPGDLLEILEVGRERGYSAEKVALAITEKTAKILEKELIPNWADKAAISKAAQKILQKREPVDSFFATMFMGLSPGYMMRNLYENTIHTIANGYLPFKPTAYMAKRSGISIIGAKRGIGQAETQFNKWWALPGRGAQKMEQLASAGVADHAHIDLLNRLWPRALDQLKDAGIPKQVMAWLRTSGAKTDISALDELAEGTIQLEPWRVMDWANINTLNKADPHLHEYVVDILQKAKTPEDAQQALRGLMQDQAKHLDDFTETLADGGAMVGTPAGNAMELVADTGKPTKKQLNELQKVLTGRQAAIMKSRNLAFKSISESVDPERWVSTLERAEGIYQLKTQELMRRQLNGYAMLLLDKLTPAEYTRYLMRAYDTIYNDLDKAYGLMIMGVGKAPVNLADVTDVKPLLRMVLQREMRVRGVALKGALEGQEIVHPAYMTGYHVPDAHFMNSINKRLREIGEPEVRTIMDLNEDQLVDIANVYRLEAKRELLSKEQMLEWATQKMDPAVMDEYPFQKLPAMPEGAENQQALLRRLQEAQAELHDRIDNIEQNRGFLAGDPEGMRELDELWNDLTAQANKFDAQIDDLVALEDQRMLADVIQAAPPGDNVLEAKKAVVAAINKKELAPSADMGEAAFHATGDIVRSLDSLIDDIRVRAKLPVTPVNNVITPKQLQHIKKLYNETHLVASEGARRARDFTLLDYADRRFFDPLLKVIYPWHYWWSRSIPNWAATTASRPTLFTNYVRLKNELREYNDNDPSVPDWAKDQVHIRPPGYKGSYFWNFDSAFNAIGQMFEDFDDPEKSSTLMGRLIDGLEKAGPAPHPILNMAMAAELAYRQKDTEGLRSYGWLSPITRTYATISGNTIEPWLWLKDAKTGKRVPFTGATKWDVNKANTYLANQQRRGEVPGERAILDAARRAGPAFEGAVKYILQDYRKFPVYASLLGLRISQRQDWENELTKVSNEYWNVEGEQRKQVLDANPWLSTLWMSWDNEQARMGMLTRNVLARIPPMKGEARTKILQSAGLSTYLMDAYYAALKDPRGVASMDPNDYEQLAMSTFNLAELFGIPDKQTAREWRQARTQSREMYEDLERRFPGNTEKESLYFDILDKEGREKANEFANAEGLFGYWREKNKMLLDNKLILKYYRDPQKVDQLAESFANIMLEQKYPDIWQKRQEYYEIPDDDWVAKNEFRRKYPYVLKSYNEQTEYLRQMRQGMFYLRQYPQTEEGVPATVDYIIADRPNASQRAVLDTLKDLAFEKAVVVPPPAMEPPKFSPAEVRVFDARQAAWNETVKKYPEYPTLEREYQQVKQVYGSDAAFLFSQEKGLLDMRDFNRIHQVRNPVILETMNNESIQYAAKALMRNETTERWGNDFWNVLNGYYALPKGKPRRAYLDNTAPYLREYWDWKDGRTEQLMEELLNQRNSIRQQRQQGIAP
jgi:hypothetical protein